MQLNQLGQGLAVSGVSALVIAGLSVTAPPAYAADGLGVRLLSQHDGVASVRRDADAPEGTSVTLTAERLDPDAAITFEVNADPMAGDAAAGWTPITSPPVETLPGYASVEWTPGSDLVGGRVALRAVATTAAADAVPATTTYSTRHDVALSGDTSAHAVSIDGAGTFFEQPYADSSRTARLMQVTGTTSATDGTVELSAWNSVAGTFQGQTDAAVSPMPLKASTGSFSFVGGGRFTGVLDISAFGAGDGDTLAVRAERDTDSVVPTELQAQTITSIEASARSVAGLESTPVTVRVLDQAQRAVIGAEVRRSADGTLVGYTDSRGEVTVAQPNSTTASYYVNTTDSDVFQDGTDLVTAPVVTSAYVPVATATEVVLADGTVFDDREYAEGDIALQVVDGRGEPFAAEEDVTYSLFPSGQAPTAPTTVTTDANGRIAVPFDPAGADGEYTLAVTAPASAGGAEQAPVTFVAGDAVLGLTPTAGSAASGAEITYTGRLTVAGQPLAGRAIDLGYTRGTEQAPGTEADAALVLGAERTLAGRLTTGPDGTFSVTVGDVVEVGGPGEAGGRLSVTARGLGETVEATADFTPAPAPAVTPTPTPTSTTTVDEDPRTVLRLTGSKMGDLVDRLRVTGPSSVAGAGIKVYAMDDEGIWRPVKSRKLNRRGDARLTLRDHNGDRFTRYYVRLLPGDGVAGSRSAVRWIK